MDEASGGAAVRADPDSAEAIAAGIEQALGERESLIACSENQGGKFTSHACGEAVLHGYKWAVATPLR
jgi:hypothetical protein